MAEVARALVEANGLSDRVDIVESALEDIDPELIGENASGRLLPPLHGALIKNEQDVHLFERLAFLARGQR